MFCPFIFMFSIVLQDSHLAVIDTLMIAHTNELVSVERVVQAVRWVYENGKPKPSSIPLRALSERLHEFTCN